MCLPPPTPPPALCLRASQRAADFQIQPVLFCVTCAATQLEASSPGDQTFGALHSASGLNGLILLDINIRRYLNVYSASKKKKQNDHIPISLQSV